MKVKIAHEIKQLNDRIDNLEKLVSDLTILNKGKLEDWISEPTPADVWGHTGTYPTSNNSSTPNYL